MTKVSIIIPTYNCRATLADALRSVFRQTFHDYEIIVIDDGSTDHSQEVINEVGKGKLIRYYYQKNKGIPGARNAGIQMAQGEYILNLDADDELMPNAIERLCDTAERNQGQWLITDVLRVEGDRREVVKSRVPSAERGLMDILEKKCYFRSYFYSKKCLEGIGLYNERQKFYDDWDLYIRLGEKNIPFAYLAEPLYIFKIRSGSTTKPRDISRNLFYMEMIYKDHYCRLALKGNREAGKLYAKYMWELASDHYHKAKNIFQALRCFIASVAFAPQDIFKIFKKMRAVPPLRGMGNQSVEKEINP